ncbi:MAG: cobaltochelatase subunit CobN [Proteobacteria bacterium]|nr:cobaltochelatase subunit CobN [Pseudomonadota bacterium]MBU1585238.1 cobaltochelatase subunit CobN [Pseudomonadota bacterium]MBU2454551.1 cobaltochelatase subunit CobN [Pseudomonadota bacterium]MBU2629128.1 cobaltochelatase subunit CobN [Pseudomonadota bacterium]
MKRLIFLILFVLWPGRLFAADMAFMVLDQNSYIANTAVQTLGLPLDIAVITSNDVIKNPDAVKDEASRAKIILADVMGRELASFLTGHYEFESKTIYALRSSRDDDTLKKKGFVFDPLVAEYYQHLSVKNIQNMLRLIAHRHFDKTITYAPIVKQPGPGLYHPDAKGIFINAKDYLNWQKTRPGFNPDYPRIGLLFFSSFMTQGQNAPVDYMIRQLEKEGFNVMPCFGREQDILKSILLDEKGSARVDMVIAWSFKFYNALTPELGELLKKLDVPIISAVNLYKDTIDQWRKNPVGIDTLEVAWSLAVPELSGLIEPIVLSGKEKILDPVTQKSVFISQPVKENIDRLMPRLKKWIILKKKPNNEKKIAILFYNHHQGKQNIGASYLNVFKSLENIMHALKTDGYTMGLPLCEKEIKDLILTSARNIGSWAPGELDKLLSSGKVVRLPVETYKHWFKDLPQDFQDKVVKQWGGPEEPGIMIHNKDFIIPAVQVENMILLPEPTRGWGDDPMKLDHDTTLYPHHQYLAVYLWLSKIFKADAMIHLGTHSTYEWTPGKQAGLSPSCPPEILITDIPNIYPYIMDDVGEGIQAKRRGRGVMISHLTPILKKADLHEEYSRMAELANEYDRARARGSITAEEKFKELMILAQKTGILKDIQDSDEVQPDRVQPDEFRDETVQKLGHYLEEIKENLIPFGMHTFGRSPDPDQASEMAEAIVKFNPDQTKKDIAARLTMSGSNEINSLVNGLNGRHIPSGPGNDPVRNPDALPTGSNFYGFNPGKIPSPAAWELGKKAAQQIIDNHLMKKKSYPRKVAVVLWAVETLRNEGVNESTILYLIGIKPKWSKAGKVLGIDLIPATRLNRPRIDVMINASGLYRDLFPEKLQFLDKAIRLAARQTDVENLIARHNQQIKTQLIKQGMDPQKAAELSQFRVFSETPGSYGNGISEMAAGSSKWENPGQVVDVFENRMGFAFGADQWGIPAKDLLKEQLVNVDVTVHSRSSNVYGLLDNDDMFQYLGGLSMAVRHESRKTPETLITQQQKKGQVNIEDMAKTLGREMRSRYLNSKWIDGMKKEDYAGAKAMADFVEHLWGWNMTTPEKVDAAKWQQTYEVYVQDKYGLELYKFFKKASPWAFQSITARMLETSRKGYWKPDRKVMETLAAQYATSVIEKGVACCDHICNNPMLNQMVVSIISIPDVLSSELVEKFKLAIEKMAGKSMEKQVKDRKNLLKKLAEPVLKSPAQKTKPDQKDFSENSKDTGIVEGYKMEKIDKQDESTHMTSSGIEWMAVLVVLAVIGLAAYGAGRKEK